MDPARWGPSPGIHMLHSSSLLGFWGVGHDYPNAADWQGVIHFLLMYFRGQVSHLKIASLQAVGTLYTLQSSNTWSSENSSCYFQHLWADKITEKTLRLITVWSSKGLPFDSVWLTKTHLITLHPIRPLTHCVMIQLPRKELANVCGWVGNLSFLTHPRPKRSECLGHKD